MKPPSKRVVRDAIRLIGYVVQHDRDSMLDTAAGIGIGTAAAELALDAVCHDDAYAGFDARARRAAAENLLRIGWLP